MSTYYGTPTAGIAYLSARGKGAAFIALADDATRAAKLLVASEFLDGKYRTDFRGYKVGQRAQEREWPRTAAVDFYGYPIDPTTVPVEVENATYELAAQESATPGSLNTNYTHSKTINEVSISGAISVKYAGALSFEDTQLIMPIIAQILAPVLTADNANTSALSSISYRV